MQYKASPTAAATRGEKKRSQNQFETNPKCCSEHKHVRTRRHRVSVRQQSLRRRPTDRHQTSVDSSVQRWPKNKTYQRHGTYQRHVWKVNGEMVRQVRAMAPKHNVTATKVRKFPHVSALIHNGDTDQEKAPKQKTSRDFDTCNDGGEPASALLRIYDLRPGDARDQSQ